QMGFAQAHAAIEKERVIGKARPFRDGHRSRVGHAVAAAHNEPGKGIARVQAWADRAPGWIGEGRFIQSHSVHSIHLARPGARLPAKAAGYAAWHRSARGSGNLPVYGH